MLKIKIARLILMTTFFALLTIIPPCSALVFLLNGTEVTGDQILDSIAQVRADPSQQPTVMHFFYNYQCQACQTALDYIRALQKKNPDIHVELHELAYTEGSQEIFTEFKNRFQKPKLSYPAVFIGEIGISGSSDIIHYAEPAVHGYLE